MDRLYPKFFAKVKAGLAHFTATLKGLPRRFKEQGYLLPTGIILTLVLTLSALLFARFSLVLYVKVDGEVIGQVPDHQVLEKLVYTTAETVEEILGEPFEMTARISYRRGILRTNEAERLDIYTVERDIYEHIPEIDKHYLISVDGVTVGYISDLNLLRSAMDRRLDAFLDEHVLSASFLSEVEFDFQFVDVEDKLSPDCIEALVETLDVETVERFIYTEILPYEVDIVIDDERFIDETQTLRRGARGEAEIIIQVTALNGQETERLVLETTVRRASVSEIILEGTLERPTTASTGTYIWPVAGRVSSHFGPRNVSVGSSNHQGIDIAAPAGEMVFAADGGEVIFTGWSGGFGNLIKIRHDNGHVTYYAHLSSIDTSVGERVYQGQFIGRVGMTGTATGNHLHFEIRINGIPVDPLPLLP